jgi:hypothetical protein
MLLPRVAKEIMRHGLLSLKVLWWPKLSIVHRLQTLGITLRKRIIRLKLAFARAILLLFSRILLGRAALMFHQPTDHAGTATRLVIGLRIALFLRRMLFRTTCARDMLISPLLKRSPLARLSLLVSF